MGRHAVAVGVGIEQQHLDASRLEPADQGLRYAAAIRHDRDAATFRELDACRLAVLQGRPQHGGRHATRDRGSRVRVAFEGAKDARRAWRLYALGRGLQPLARQCARPVRTPGLGIRSCTKRMA